VDTITTKNRKRKRDGDDSDSHASSPKNVVVVPTAAAVVGQAKQQKEEGGCTPNSPTTSPELKRLRKQAKIQILHAATENLRNAMEEIKGQRKRLSSDRLKKCIDDAKATVGGPLADCVVVNADTLRARLRAGHNTKVMHPGPISPLLPLEPLFRDMISDASSRNQPMHRDEFLKRVDSMVRGTVYETRIREAHRRRRKREMPPNAPLVGLGYWRGFRRRNAQLFESGENHDDDVETTDK